MNKIYQENTLIEELQKTKTIIFLYENENLYNENIILNDKQKEKYLNSIINFNPSTIYEYNTIIDNKKYNKFYYLNINSKKKLLFILNDNIINQEEKRYYFTYYIKLKELYINENELSKDKIIKIFNKIKNIEPEIIYEFECDKKNYIMNATNDKNKIIGYIENITNIKKYYENILQNQIINTIGKISGGIAHEFNNYLMSISGSLSLLKKHQLYQDNKYINNIEKAIENASKLIGSLLSYSDQKIYIKSNMELNSLVKEIINIVITIKNKKNIKIINFKNIIYIEGYKILIQNLILNIIINLLNYSNDSITIETNIEDSKDKLINIINGLKFIKGRYATITIKIKNNKNINNPLDIFNPFFISESNIGYNIIKNMEELYNIQIQIINSLDIIYKLYFKIDEEKLIYILDDDELIREVLKEMLENLNYQVETFDTGLKLFERYKEKNPHLLILDMIMPEYQGDKVYLDIKKLNINQKILFLSGYTNSNIFKELKISDKYFLQKPVNINDLQKKILELL